MNTLRSLYKDASIGGAITAIIIVLLGITSSAVLVFQAAESAGLDTAGAGGWMGTVCVVIGVLSVIFSLIYRAPVLFAWSTAGAALLVTGLKGVPVEEAVGAFLVSGFLIFLCGVTGIFEKLMNHIPVSLASALLAGILLPFTLAPFASLGKEPLIVGGMIAIYLLAKKFLPRWAMPLVLVGGWVICALGDQIHLEQVGFYPTRFQWITPALSVNSLLSVAIPLFAVNMTTQNLTGITVMRANGYNTPFSPLLTWSGIAQMLSAPFGGFAINLAAITAAIAMGPEAGPRKEKRYFAGVTAGILYALIGLTAGTITAVFAAFPKEMILTLTGLALMSTVTSCLQTAFDKESEREAAFITFVVTASGLTLFSISSAFWGLVAGSLTLIIFSFKKFT